MMLKNLGLTICLLILSIFVFTQSQASIDGKIKLYACYTPSHEVLFRDWFLPSLKDDYELVVEKHEQLCPSTNYMSDGWTNATLKKVEMLVRAIKANWGNIFVYSDVDIQFFRQTKDLLLDLIQDMDMVIQRDDPFGTICTGFFMCRANKNTLAFWQEIQRLLSDKDYLKKNPISDDQIVFNRLVKEKRLSLIWDFLPARFLSGGTLTGKHWNAGNKLVIPTNIVLHHGNWTEHGVQNKIDELRYVRKEVLGK